MRFTGIMAGKLILGLLFIWYTQSFLHTVTYCDLSEINTWAYVKTSFRCLLKSLFWPLASYNVHAQALSRVWLFVTLRTVAHQGPLSMGFSRQEYCSRLPLPPPGEFPNTRIKPASPGFRGILYRWATRRASGQIHLTTSPLSTPPWHPNLYPQWNNRP